MNKIIILVALLFCTVTSAAQIMPWQIQNDPDGANRILLTDSIGEYLRVGLEDVISDSIDLDYIDFNLVGEPAWNEGRIYYDTTTHSLTIFDDISESSLQVGQETRVRVYNGNGAILTDGSAVSVSGLTPDGVIEVELAIASSKVSALNTIGIVTSDIGIGEYGWATTSGVVNNINTSAYTEGSAIYLSDQVAGAYTTVRPNSPSYEVRMGGIIEQDVATGKIYAELRIITNTHDNFNFFTGAVLQSNSVEIVSDGVSINCSLNNSETTDSLALVVDDGYLLVEDGINIDLPAAVTDSAPIEYWVYIDSDGAITYSTSGFPSGAVVFIPIARVIVPTLATAQSFGVLKCHAYTDHLRGAGGGGHLQHINSWIRKRPAQWISGVVLIQDPVEGTSTDTIDISYTSGVVSQLHNQNMPAFDSKVDPIFVANDPDADYTIIEGINTGDIPEDSEGVLIGNKYHTVVLWGVASQEAKDCQVYMNLASGSYTSQADGENDTDKHTNYNIPAMFTGTGFLISELLLKKSGSNYEVIRTIDLRGLIPSAGASGGVSGGAGITLFDELTDTPTTKVGSGEYGVRVNAAENALEYFEVLDNDAANELPKFTKLAFEPTGAKQGDFWQNTDPPDNLELYLYDKGAWVKIADRYQELELIGNVLFLNPEGNSVDLSGYTNTDDQTINISSNTLYIEDGNFVDLLPYLDNTDNQDTSNIDGLLTYVQQYGADGIGTDTSGTYHISIDNDTSSTNEIQDTTNIVGLLEFVQQHGEDIPSYTTATDPFSYQITSTAGVEFGSLSGAGYLFRTPSLNTTFSSGLAIDGTYETTPRISTINVNAFGVKSDGDWSSDLAFGTSYEEVLSEKVRIKSDGKVGFMKTDPSATVDINGDLRVSDRIGSTPIEQAAFDANGQLVDGEQWDYVVGGIDYAFDVGIGGTLQLDNAEQIRVGDNSAQFNLVMSNGAPYYGYSLEYPSSYIGGWARVLGGVVPTGAVGLSDYKVSYGATGNGQVADKFFVDITGDNYLTNDFVIKSSGVGIGTNTPAAKLDVVGDVRISDRIGGAATKSAAFDANGQLVEVDLTTADGKFVDGTDPLDAVYMDGDVGIGISSPAYGSNLHVVGSVYFDAGLDNLFINRAGNTTFTGSNNIGIGTASFEALTSGSKNLGLGYESLQALTSGSDNFAMGPRSLEELTIGTNNVAIGYRSAGSIDPASTHNISMGTLALGNASGDYNTGIGFYSGYGSSGSSVSIGAFAGYVGTEGSVSIGHNAGRNNTSDNRLYIDNSTTATPLIYGEFDNDIIEINGSLKVTDLTGGTAVNGVGVDANDQLVTTSLPFSGSYDDLTDQPLIPSISWSTLLGVVYVDNKYVGIGLSDPIFELHMEGGNAYFDGTTFLGVGAAPVNGQVWSKVTGGMGWVDAALDDQTLTLTSSTLAISDGNTINLNVAYGGLESNFQTISTTSATTVNFSNKWGEEINTTASTTSERITVDSTAMYTVLVRGDITGYTLDEMLQLEIWVNGVQVEQHKFKAIESVFPINFTDDIEINAGEYIELKLDSVTDTDYEYNDLKLTVKRAY